MTMLFGALALVTVIATIVDLLWGKSFVRRRTYHIVIALLYLTLLLTMPVSNVTDEGGPEITDMPLTMEKTHARLFA